MKKTHRERRALLDRLEKNYIKKVQLHAFKRENEVLKHQLSAVKGMNVTELRGRDSLFFEMPDYRLKYM